MQTVRLCFFLLMELLTKLMKMKSLKHAKPLLQFPSFIQQKSYTSIPLLCPTQELQTTTTTLKLTNQELTKINLLIPRLCLSDNLTTATHLTTTALLTNPPHSSISLSILVHSLTSQPDMTQPMSLLTTLRHSPQAHNHLTPITTMLVMSYVRKKRVKEAFKVYQWMTRPGSPCKVEKIVFLGLVDGFCELGLVVDGLRVLRDMVGVGFVPGDGLRRRVFRKMLMEARVKEGLELDKALCFCANGGVDGIVKVRDLLDNIIGNWTE
ncbi:uncharacterized protein LOC126683089 [Mercurialis annua]|uniref:uncharacterized protein LOC126683089 n=1 Tax=Mercurialis annua TaxID=3986 RepID=UPI00215FC0DF|nr:uncharacterized protein LOC126683089 [Mercurialis annua]